MKLPDLPSRMTTDDLYTELYIRVQGLRRNGVGTQEDQAQLQLLVEETGWRLRKLITAGKDRERKLTWWRLLSVALVIGGVALILIVSLVLLSKGA